MKDFLVPILTFVAGLFGGLLPHVQRPLTDYRKTLTDISQLMLCSAQIMFGNGDIAEAEGFYNDIRKLHARLMSSADSIPRSARRILQLLGLLRPRDQIELGARTLIGISNQVISVKKDTAHLTTLIQQLGKALDITV